MPREVFLAVLLSVAIFAGLFTGLHYLKAHPVEEYVQDKAVRWLNPELVLSVYQVHPNGESRWVESRTYGPDDLPIIIMDTVVVDGIRVQIRLDTNTVNYGDL